MPSTSSCAYSYTYCIEARFYPAIDYQFFKLRVIPQTNASQRLLSHELHFTPACHWNSSIDGQGNLVQYGGYSERHDCFRVVSSGVVECGIYRIPDPSPNPIYRYVSPLTACSPAMMKWLKAQTLPQSPAEAALALMHSVNQMMTYVTGVTDNASNASQAFEQRRGVCQDYAHLMIALCRRHGLYARYANGLIPGEGVTHAWVEVHDGEAWLAYDPTHDCAPCQGYIKLAHGRDVSDCPSNRGRLYGWTNETLHVTVKVIKKQEN